jgi:hypothetical protein
MQVHPAALSFLNLAEAIAARPAAPVLDAHNV